MKTLMYIFSSLGIVSILMLVVVLVIGTDKLAGYVVYVVGGVVVVSVIGLLYTLRQKAKKVRDREFNRFN